MPESPGRLTRQRCFNHPRREAAALCPECKRYFCRECVTDHEDRVLCASCLKALKKDKGRKRGILAPALRLSQAVFGIVITWLFFYYLAEALLSIPDSFHDGTIWKETLEFFL